MALLALVLSRTSRPLGWTLVVVATLAVVAGGIAPLTTTAQQSTNPANEQGRKVTLHDQLTSGLRAVTKSDKAFIDKVVLRVKQGKLPRRLVDSTFLWARDRAARRGPMRALRPMVYFQPVLTARAKRIGVQL